MAKNNVAGYYQTTRRPEAKGTARYLVGPWQHTVAFDAICPDGKVRRVRANQSPDTFFSHPGRCTIGKRTVRGYVTVGQDGEYLFNIYRGE
jgi:hypothetical protein